MGGRRLSVTVGHENKEVNVAAMHAFAHSDEDGDGMLDLMEFRVFLYKSKLLMNTKSSNYKNLTSKLFVLADTLSEKELDFGKKTLASRNVVAGGNSSSEAIGISTKGRRRSVIGKVEPTVKRSADTIPGVTVLGVSQLYTLATEPHTLTDPGMNALITELKMSKLSDTENTKKKRMQKEAMAMVMEQNIRYTQSYHPSFSASDLDNMRNSRLDRIREEKDAKFRRDYTFKPDCHGSLNAKVTEIQISESNDVGHYRKKDNRTHVERVLEECTFKPETKESPFVSSRTLGRNASVRGQQQRFWDDQVAGDTSAVTKKKMGPPVKVPLYFINPERPPEYIDKHVVALESTMFRCVAYFEEYTAPEEAGAFGGAEEHPDQDDGPASAEVPENIPTAPPAPNWAGRVTPSPQKHKIVIKKGAAKKPEPKAKSGPSWEDIMKEMKARASGEGKGLKTAPPEKKTPGKLKKSKGKKSGKKFDNVIDELSHTLRKLKGDVSDSDDDPDSSDIDDTTDAPPPPPVPPADAGTSAASGAATHDDKYKKYRIMAKNKLPEGAIRQRMLLDGLEDEEQDVFFVGDWQSGDSSSLPSSPSPPPAPPQPPSSDAPQQPSSSTKSSADDAYKKYRIMAKNKLPEGAIRQRMMLDGLDGEEQDEFFTGDWQSGDSPAPTSPSPAPVGGEIRDVAFNIHKYVTMQKCGLPEAAVRQRMMLDGVDSDDVEAFFRGAFDGTDVEVQALNSTAVATGQPKFDMVPITPKKARNVEPPTFPSLAKRLVVHKMPKDFSSFDDNFGFTAPLDRSGGLTVPMGVYIWSTNRKVPPGKTIFGGHLFSKTTALKEREFLEYSEGLRRMQEQEAAEATKDAAQVNEARQSMMNVSDLHVTSEATFGPDGKIRPEDLPSIRNMDKFLDHAKKAHRAREANESLYESQRMRQPVVSNYTGTPTKPVEFRSHLIERSSRKTHTFRKTDGHNVPTEEYEMYPFAELQAHGDVMVSYNPNAAKWMCSLRSDSSDVSSENHNTNAFDKQPTEGHSPILRVDRHSRVGETKRLKEERQRVVEAREREEKRRHREMLRLKAMKAAVDSNSYRKSSTRDYAQRALNQVGGNAHGRNVKKDAMAAYAKYMSKRTAVAKK